MEIISSRYAIIAYVIILLGLLATLVVFVLHSENKSSANAKLTIVGSMPALPVSAAKTAPAATASGVATDGQATAVPIAGVPMAAAAAAPEEDESERAPRFCMLSRIDDNKAKYKEKVFDKNVTLKKFCEDFRNYASYKHNLYYDIKDIRRFVAGMAVSQILILQGMSGTGKTSLAHAMGSFIENTSTVIPVQPMWKERTDL
ncbi:MAG: hypothetical protein IJY18_01480, partial [Clostridia bacterium]|nr:hypothetical protein [Clostridia bacterium]